MKLASPDGVMSLKVNPGGIQTNFIANRRASWPARPGPPRRPCLLLLEGHLLISTSGLDPSFKTPVKIPVRNFHVSLF